MEQLEPIDDQLEMVPELPVPVIGYASPMSISQGRSALWSQRGRLYTTIDADFPARCVRCNSSEVRPKRVRKVMYWHNPLFYLLILTGVLIYAIVAMALMKKSKVNFALCNEHAKQRNTSLLIAWLGSLTTVALFILAIAAMVDVKNHEVPVLGLSLLGLGFVLMIGLIVFARLRVSVLRPAEITAQVRRLQRGRPGVSDIIAPGVMKRRLAGEPAHRWNDNPHNSPERLLLNERTARQTRPAGSPAKCGCIHSGNSSMDFGSVIGRSFSSCRILLETSYDFFRARMMFPSGRWACSEWNGLNDSCSSTNTRRLGL